MKLAEFLTKYKIKNIKFSRDTGISITTLRNITLELHKPSLEIAEVIEKYTKGIVKAKELRNSIPGKSSREKRALPKTFDQK